MNAGLDFETKILYKSNAAKLLRAELCKPSWNGGEVIAISGVTDCYQPAERRLRVTRSIIEVLVEARQAFGMITKNGLVLRDLDLLASQAKQNICTVNLSITTLDADLARDLEPRTSPPAKRLRAIKELSAAGVPVRVMVAPIIPGLTDTEIPAILQAAAEAGVAAPVGKCSAFPGQFVRSSKIGSPVTNPPNATASSPASKPSAAAK